MKQTPLTAPAPLDAGHEIADFDCGKPALNDWLYSRAGKAEGLSARTYVVCLEKRVVGYYALAAGAVQRTHAPSRLSRNMPDPIPVFVLARLAVDRNYSGRNIGSGLLKDGLKRALQASNAIGARAVLVHAIDEDAARFYLQYGFMPFQRERNTLFLPIRQIAAAL
ncbi:MAG: GNAT family N-acetyltransferase [Alphaproteobacteria bacterium]|jgi:GNAT superfamily N-acetyltransferase|nr:GNAT family N-acetyltransferase [Alphaproteobacteria bacterium]MBN9568843.1 GNAT family N-acetyltransferase [Alphaproteobacteria bacterium]MBN9579486.1 GNAT family N-acetyltransferase [Alphaproteobacteria bacterium]OJU56599.1 MAG: hypothetical protein BGO00_13935 [Alphaproteobacteria bacterium 62-8]